MLLWLQYVYYKRNVLRRPAFTLVALNGYAEITSISDSVGALGSQSLLAVYQTNVPGKSSWKTKRLSVPSTALNNSRQKPGSEPTFFTRIARHVSVIRLGLTKGIPSQHTDVLTLRLGNIPQLSKAQTGDLVSNCVV